MADLLAGIYEAYVGHKNFSMGRQPAPLDDTDTVSFSFFTRHLIPEQSESPLHFIVYLSPVT